MIKRFIPLLFTFTMLSSSMTNAMTGDSVAAEFRGEWIPAKASCNSSLKTVIEANKVSFINGSQTASYPKLEQCFSCMGHDVNNITLLSTDAMGDSPFTIYLDSSKKIPAIQVAFDNDKKLGTRFPFGKSSLKKCPSTSLK
ncbi:MAG: hypothetical protein V4525_02290 [Pseudomonadota bacterium]